MSCAPAFSSIFWPQSEKPPDLGRSPKPGHRNELPPGGRTYVHIHHPWVPDTYQRLCPPVALKNPSDATTTPNGSA